MSRELVCINRACSDGVAVLVVSYLSNKHLEERPNEMYSFTYILTMTMAWRNFRAGKKVGVDYVV